MSGPSVGDPEKEWMEKIFDECEDEFYESFGVYDGKNILHALISFIISFLLLLLNSHPWT